MNYHEENAIADARQGADAIMENFNKLTKTFSPPLPDSAAWLTIIRCMPFMHTIRKKWMDAMVMSEKDISRSRNIVDSEKEAQAFRKVLRKNRYLFPSNRQEIFSVSGVELDPSLRLLEECAKRNRDELLADSIIPGSFLERRTSPTYICVTKAERTEMEKKNKLTKEEALHEISKLMDQIPDPVLREAIFGYSLLKDIKALKAENVRQILMDAQKCYTHVLAPCETAEEDTEDAS
eukprot:Pompholyxophrys_punicea_v1_NODE_733_length_1379_cov_141.421450.p1 type:complete len:236 gc:universal NODE_733_length_1379_cov_141.421450:510-1217(+)